LGIRFCSHARPHSVSCSRADIWVDADRPAVPPGQHGRPEGLRHLEGRIDMHGVGRPSVRVGERHRPRPLALGQFHERLRDELPALFSTMSTWLVSSSAAPVTMAVRPVRSVLEALAVTTSPVHFIFL
jgi:hypothetical protein